MSDSVYRGPVPTNNPEPAVTAKMYEAPDERDMPSREQQDHLAIEEATRELREQRKQTGDPWNPGPIMKRRYTGGDAPDEITLRRANEDLGFTKRGEIAAEQVEAAKRMFGDDFEPTPEVIKATVDDAHRWDDGIKAPPVKIGLRVDGQEIKPLDDDWPMLASDALPNAKLAAKFVGDWRQAREQEAQQFAAALDQAKSDKLAAEAQERHRVEAEAAQRKDQQEQQAREAQATEQRRQQELVQGFQQVSHAEAQLAQEVNRWDAWAHQFPEMRDQASFDLMVRTSPERHQQFQEARQQRDAAAQRLNELRLVRTAAQQNIAAVRQQQLDQWSRGEDQRFWGVLEKKYPALAKDPAKLHRATSDYLKRTTGLSEQQITAAWKAGKWRSAGEQVILLDAVVSDMARNGRKELAAHRALLPPVQRPGTYRPAGADAESDIGALERRMQNAKPREQIRLAARLTAAKRAAGQL